MRASQILAEDAVQSGSFARRLGYAIGNALLQSYFIPMVLLVVATGQLVPMNGEYATDDDWIHARAVERLLQDGYYRGHPYVAANLIAQAYWGAAFCRLFGFSFTILRLSNLVLLVITGWGVARCGAALGLPRWLSVLSGLVVISTPLVLSLAYTFMTDVPFLSLTVLSGLCFLEEFKRPGRGWMALASSLAVVAFFVRQYGVFIPTAAGVSLLVLAFRGYYHLSRRSIVELAGPWLIAAVYYVHFLVVKESGTTVFVPVSGRIYQSIMDGLRQPFVGLCYLGLFAFPIGVYRYWQLLAGGKDEGLRWSRLLTWGCYIAASLTVFILPRALAWLVWVLKHKESVWLSAYPCRMPLLPGVLYDLGVGVVQIPEYPGSAVRLNGGWWILTAVALTVAGQYFVVALMAGGRLLRKPVDERDRIEACQSVFLIAWAILFVVGVYNPWRVFVFDRYLLPALPAFLLLICLAIKSPGNYSARYAAAAATLLVYGFSIVALQDYVGWNQAAWQALDRLRNVYHVSPGSIRGVDAYNGWYNSDEYIKMFRTKDWTKGNLTGRGPWVFDDEFRVGVGSTPAGYAVFERVPYFSWLGMVPREIVVFKRCGKTSPP